MKSLLFLTLFLPVLNSMAQKINGKYQGELTAANQSKLESSMMLTVKGTLITGTMTLAINGTNITSTLSGNLSDGVYKGTLTNETGTANFSLQDLSTLGAGMTALFVQVIDQGQVILTGMLEKAGAASKTQNNIGQIPIPNKAPKANDRLPRDPNLIGVWNKFSAYTRNSMNTEEYWAFNADGTMEGKSRSSAIIYDRVEANYNGGWTEHEGFKAEREAGIRWFTRDGQLLYKMPDGSEKFQLYYKIEHYDGKINLFMRVNPNQPKASIMFRKVN